MSIKIKFKIILGVLFIVVLAQNSYTQCTPPDFTLSNSNPCINETIKIIPNGTYEFYNWDFCGRDMQSTPDISQSLLSEARRPFGYTTIKDGNMWYGFMTSSDGSNNLLRLDFGESLNNTPQVTDLGNPGGFLSFPEDIDLIKIEENWYALIALPFASTKGVLLYDFGSNIESVPTGTFLGGFGISSNIRGLSVALDGQNIILGLAHSTANISLVNFRDSFTNVINPEHIINTSNLSNATNVFSLDIYYDCDSWYIFSASTDYHHKLHFGNSLFRQPLSEESYFSNEVGSTIFDVDVGTDGEQTFVVLSDVSNSTILFDYGKDLSVNSPPTLINSVGLPRLTNLSIHRINGGYTIIGIDNTEKKLTTIEYKNSCGSAVEFSNEKTPKNIMYSTPGEKTIILNVVDSNGNTKSVSKSITVSSSIAPDIATTSQNICRNNAVNFTSQNTSGGIASYAWDFGDTNTSAARNPSHTYTSAGEYEVRLKVTSTNGCENFTTRKVKIYNEPVPNFTLPSGTICTNQRYTFTNRTVDNFDGNLTYKWLINGTQVSTDRELVHQFTSSGAKQVKLITSIPGCEVEQVQNIANVALGASPSYIYDKSKTCLGSSITFTNQSTGANITSYLWDFGDTRTSTDVSPIHRYVAAGAYNVSLQVTNSAGCITTYQEEVVIHSLPDADFEAELACTDRTTQLTDLTTVANANVTTWDWDFNDPASGSENVSSEEDPLHIFSQVGDYDVSLTTISNYGCEATTQKTISVLESPTPIFSFQPSCVGTAFQFTDESVPNAGSSIIGRAWNIDGNSFTEQNPQYAFTQPGNYDVSLTIRSSNNCIVTTSQTVTVGALPTVAFELDDNCENTELRISDTSIVPSDVVSEWFWSIDGEEVGTNQELVHTFTNDGNYDISLRIITGRGCIVTGSQTVQIFAQPEPDFSMSSQYATPATQIAFTNLTQSATQYLWNFGDGSPATDVVSPLHTFDELGTYDVTLQATNTQGCSKTITKQVFIVNPAIDLSIGELIPFNDGKNYLYTITNNGTIPVNNLTATITLNNDVTIEEQFTTEILPNGNAISRSLEFSLPSSSEVEFLCVTLSTPEGKDVNASDNENCINIGKGLTIIPPYPNPSFDREHITLPLIGESIKTLDIVLTDTQGKTIYQQEVALRQNGLNNIELSVINLQPGIYIVEVRHTKGVESFRIFVN